MRAPEFWQRSGPISTALYPFALAYGAGACLRSSLVRPWKAAVPVICVGNLVAGGAGKTPVALALGAWLRARGRQLHFLTRGYGGRAAGPLRVEPGRHGYREVGDEALLLATEAPTWVARDRAAGARAAIGAGAAVLVMDDGLQNPTIAKDVSLLVVDGGYGFGNGRMLPAGPLREPARRGLGRADAVVLVGTPDPDLAARLEGEPRVLRARLAPAAEAAGLAGRKVVAFAGIGRPEKFFATLAEIGCDIVAREIFPDHHPYAPREIEAILRLARERGALAVTTAKDAVRLPEDARGRVGVVEVAIEWEDPEALAAVLLRVTGHA